MPRTKRTRADIPRLLEDLDDMKVIEAVCDGFCRGLSATEVRKEVEERLGTRLSREKPYQILSLAGMNGWLEFIPPLEYALAEHLRQNYPFLEDVDVVRTTHLEPVAARAARMLLQLVRQAAYEKSEVHVGLAGGWTVLTMVKHFARLLDQPMEDLPDRIVFHAMVTGLQLDDPETDPNTFYNYLRPLPIETKFKALYGPVMPDAETIAELRRDHKPTEDAFLAGDEIDIIATSGSRWQDEHSQLKELMTKYQDPEEKVTDTEKLEEEKCVGDILWQPINAQGPIETDLHVQAMTLKELAELPGDIRGGTKVLLILGPCGACGAARGDLLRAVLELKERYVTHLVTDIETGNLSAPESDESD